MKLKSEMVSIYAVRSISTFSGQKMEGGGGGGSAYWNFGKPLYARVLGERVGSSGSNFASNFTVLLF